MAVWKQHVYKLHTFAPDNKKCVKMSLPEDPMMLYSFLNMKLRDEYPSLDALCEDLDVSKDEILEKMKGIGFEYDSKRNRFW